MADKPNDPTAKLTRSSIHRGVSDHNENILDAVHQVLRNAGLPGVTVHSIRFSPPQGFEEQCDPPCQPGQRCVLDSNGGHVRWVCVPAN